MQFFTLIFELIKALWDWICLLSPIKFTIVHEGYGGVKYSWGKVKKNAHDGVNWGGFGSSFSIFEVRLCKSQLDDAVSCFTKDAIPFEIFAVYTYDVIDAGKYMVNSEDTEWLLSDIVETRIREIVEKTEFLTLLQDSDKINKKLLKFTQKDADEFNLGIKMRRARLNHIKCTDAVLLRTKSIDRVMDYLNTLPWEQQKNATAIIAAAAPVQPLEDTEFEEE